MKRVARVQTADGVVHLDVETATKHLDKQFGDIITTMAHDLARLDKYRQFMDYIERHLDQFVKLSNLKRDMRLEPPLGEDDEQA